jgi:hypothetical protein
MHPRLRDKNSKPAQTTRGTQTLSLHYAQSMHAQMRALQGRYVWAQALGATLARVSQAAVTPSSCTLDPTQ